MSEMKVQLFREIQKEKLRHEDGNCRIVIIYQI